MSINPFDFDAFLLPHLLEKCEEVCAELEKAQPIFAAKKTKLKSSLDASRRQFEEGYPPDLCVDMSYYQGLQDDVDGHLHRLLRTLYALSRKLPLVDPEGKTVAAAREDHYHKYAEGVYGIKVFLSENDKGEEVILIRLPMLEVAPNYFSRSGKHNFPVTYGSIYSHEVADGMELLIKEDPTICRRYRMKTLSFFFLYDTKTGVADSNNHDTKLVIDAVTGMLLGGDTAYCCSFSFDSLFDTGHPEGTYICLSQGKSNYANEEILKKFP